MAKISQKVAADVSWEIVKPIKKKMDEVEKTMVVEECINSI